MRQCVRDRPKDNVRTDTRRQVYVYRKGRWGLCVCMLARGRVLVIKVSENSRKWLQEGGRVILRACV